VSTGKGVLRVERRERTRAAAACTHSRRPWGSPSRSELTLTTCHTCASEFPRRGIGGGGLEMARSRYVAGPPQPIHTSSLHTSCEDMHPADTHKALFTPLSRPRSHRCPNWSERKAYVRCCSFLDFLVRRLVLNGPNVWPGANYVENEVGKRTLKFGDRRRVSAQLKVRNRRTSFPSPY
jgi:hypothetical protein